ncbi:hypothetical protein VHEMI00660 [[Torrubiella] hemipterigena]|uniref:Cell wall galactomannoprotein n=1 Tax=[Torrubiella] hemipterigena TaxID=1531966 RepID=A0A0A1SQZ8_9HYPO|nr:hypothetical protein VHEMI00660 [[Torrubiella] hemipterigena]
MTSFKYITLFIVVTASAATVDDVLRDINGIYNNAGDLNDEVKNWDGQLLTAAPQLVSLSLTQQALDSGVKHTDELPALLTTAEAKRILDLVNVTLYVGNPITVDTVISRKSDYAKIGQESIILEGLKKLRTGHGHFAGNVLNRLPEECTETGLKLTYHISEALRKGILAFES